MLALISRTCLSYLVCQLAVSSHPNYDFVIRSLVCSQKQEVIYFEHLTYNVSGQYSTVETNVIR
jgi:hypothetical protein